MMLCHRFYMRQSHAKNDWQTIATVCIFLACKLEETPRFLNDFVVVAYEMMNKWDRLLLSTITFDLDIQLPYKPLVVALKKLNIFRDHLARVAWNFVNDWLCTTLCLQYRPHYIVDGSMFVAVKLQKVKLPTEKGRVWWLGKYAYLCHQKKEKKCQYHHQGPLFSLMRIIHDLSIQTNQNSKLMFYIMSSNYIEVKYFRSYPRPNTPHLIWITIPSN
ncbi:hypothetical protein UlMin_030922 [Ulmus minor]